jgi:hypothetical protein
MGDALLSITGSFYVSGLFGLHRKPGILMGSNGLLMN